jgi:D-glycero-D-manno-heptose 1,7-bisphosphate phosphatase
MSTSLERRRAVFFDRDGTLIIDKVYLNDPNGVEYIPGVFQALKKLRDHGFLFFVVTNQSGIPRGLVKIKNLFEIHKKMRSDFALHAVDLKEFYYAPYLTDFDHILRKPNPGMILEAAEHYHIDLGSSYMVGDRMVDVEAGHRAGCTSIMVGDRENPKDFDWAKPEFVGPSVVEAAEWILTIENQCENR